MKFQFRLAWHKPGKSAEQAFKSPAAAALFTEYTRRISKYTPCEVNGFAARGLFRRAPGEVLWLCDSRERSTSSDALAALLQKTLDSGRAKTLSICIGSSNGWSKENYDAMKPDFIWSFGALTLPHELAAVLSAEQIYRAWTILKKEPYHLGH